MSPPHGTPDNSQSVLRRRALDARRSLTEEQREDLSLCIYESTIRDPAFQRVTTIATYLPADDEVNTWPLIERAWRMKKRVFAPVVKKNAGMRFYRLSADTALSTNRFGLPEPESDVEIDPRQLQLVYTPLAAFDDERRRIGMGGGYFDRAFAFMKHRVNYRTPKLIGLAFDCQRVEQISASPWDIPLFQVITESGITR